MYHDHENPFGDETDEISKRNSDSAWIIAVSFCGFVGCFAVWVLVRLVT